MKNIKPAMVIGSAAGLLVLSLTIVLLWLMRSPLQVEITDRTVLRDAKIGRSVDVPFRLTNRSSEPLELVKIVTC